MNNKISEQLKNTEFCRVRIKTKTPFENNWQNKPYTYNEIQKFFPQENYGVLCGHNDLAVIDCDEELLVNVIKKGLPPTFAVKTGRGGIHFYYFIPELKKKIILNNPVIDDKKERHLGEVQFIGQQVVGPGSIHPNGKKYEIINDIEIQKISLKKLYSVIEKFVKKEKINYVKIENALSPENEIDKLKVLNIWGITKMKQHGKEFYGSHPIHGSDGGANFWINPKKNTWHCFRCDSGGGPLSAIAVKEGIIDCADAVSGGLRGDKAKQAIQVAKEKYGLTERQKMSYQEPPPIEAYEENIIMDFIPENKNILKEKEGFLSNIKSMKELLAMKPKENIFLVNKMIVENGINAITAKTGAGKSLFILKMAMDIAKGEPFLGKYKVKKNKVLIMDLEMSENSILDRIHTIVKENVDVDIFYKGDITLDKKSHQDILIKTIKEKGYGVIIFDTLSVAHSKEENSNSEMREILQIMLDIINKTNCTIMFLHHHGKNADYKMADKSRGATSIIDKASSHIILTRSRKDFFVIDDNNQFEALHLLVEQGKQREREGMKKFGLDIWYNKITNTTKFKYAGEIEDEDMEGKAIKFLMDFIKENEKYTKLELIEFGKKEQIGETNIKNAINQLTDNKYLDKNKFKELPSRGYYYYRKQQSVQSVQNTF